MSELSRQLLTLRLSTSFFELLSLTLSLAFKYSLCYYCLLYFIFYSHYFRYLFSYNNLTGIKLLLLFELNKYVSSKTQLLLMLAFPT